MLEIGQTAPDFTTTDQHGTTQSVRQYHGQWVVLYFYPKDSTPGCIKEACAFRDVDASLRQSGLVVLGISGGSVASHRRFSEKQMLDFPLLLDEQHEIARLYGAYGKKRFMGRTILGINRITYLINPLGIIVKTYIVTDPAKHPAEVVADWQKLRQAE